MRKSAALRVIFFTLISRAIEESNTLSKLPPALSISSCAMAFVSLSGIKGYSKNSSTSWSGRFSIPSFCTRSRIRCLCPA